MPRRLKIAYTERAFEIFGTVNGRDSIKAAQTDFTDTSALIITDLDSEFAENEKIRAFGVPVFLILTGESNVEKLIECASGIIDLQHGEHGFYERQIVNAAEKYEEEILPPFFGSLLKYVERGNSEFDCPGHQGGAYFRKHPGGKIFYDFYGENTFRADLCNADVAMGDLLIHEGPALAAQKHAAKVFHADKAYFVLNGTSGANKVVLNALLAPGDLVLYERNNHKSIPNCNNKLNTRRTFMQ